LSTQPTIDAVRAVLEGKRYRHANEHQLQDGIELVLQRAGIIFDREVILSPRDRIDFLVGGVGIEVKCEGGLSAVARQLLRYTIHPQIESILLVSSRSQLSVVPSMLGGKPVQVLVLLGGLT
jgi:hypothetical protein